jgi:hypothetical protein
MRVGPGSEVVGGFIVAVDVEVDALLLDREDLLARRIDVLQLDDTERFEPAPAPTQRGLGRHHRQAAGNTSAIHFSARCASVRDTYQTPRRR